jgi:hypothetical protein
MHLIDQQLNLMIRGRFNEAWKISEKLEELDPEDLRHRFNRGWFLIEQGKFQEGFQSLEAGRFLKVYGDSHLPTTKPIWNQQKLKNKTVILNLEGGIGDQFIHARFAKDIAKLEGKCVVCCHPSIFCLLNRLEGVERCIQRAEVPYTKHDYWIPSFSASWLFGYTHDTLPNKPYIFSNFESNKIWKNIINSKKIKVGIRWSGNPKFEHQQFRRFSPSFLTNLKKYNEIQLYSLQRDEDVIELPEDIIDLQHLIISWEDTCSAIENLDLVISSCTSVAHLASAMGKPTWVIVPILPYHIWAYGKEYSPWYQNSTRIFRQQKFGEWDKTFNKLEATLVTKYGLKTKDKTVKRIIENKKIK